MRKILFTAAVVAMSTLAGGAMAATVVLGSGTQCSEGNASNGIMISDVTGDAGGATDCWGAFDGNDPGPSGDGFSIDGEIFDFVAKTAPEGNEGAAIDLAVDSFGFDHGEWSFDEAAWDSLGFGDFLIVLKANSKPGFAVWLFEGADAASSSGDWHIAWNPDLSHLSVYAKVAAIPVPAAGFMLLAGLGGLAGLRRRRRKA